MQTVNPRVPGRRSLRELLGPATLRQFALPAVACAPAFGPSHLTMSQLRPIPALTVLRCGRPALQCAGVRRVPAHAVLRRSASGSPWASPFGSLRFTTSLRRAVAQPLLHRRTGRHRYATLSCFAKDQPAPLRYAVPAALRTGRGVSAPAFVACDSPLCRRSSHCDSPCGGSANAQVLNVNSVQ